MDGVVDPMLNSPPLCELETGYNRRRTTGWVYRIYITEIIKLHHELSADSES